ncbi:MAG: hypothetical protein ACM3U2_03015 [Deltaproteobacteria bacterium]
MRRLTLASLVLGAILILTEAPVFAQMGVSGMGGMGGGGAMNRPRRRLRRNQSPVLSPALNMIPGVATSFEGQFLMRTVPQEQFNRSTAQFNRQIQGLQNQAIQQEEEIKKGIGKTGHASRFMNYGNYYSLGSAARRRGQ